MKPRSVGFSTMVGSLPLGKKLSSIHDFENNKNFRAISEAKSEYDGKLKTGNSVDSSLWSNMLMKKREAKNK